MAKVQFANSPCSVVEADRISRLDEEQIEYEYVDEVLTITHLEQEKLCRVLDCVLLMPDFSAFWGFLDLRSLALALKFQRASKQE